MTLNKFSEQTPACDIFELLEYLESDDPENFLFRGQNKHYPYLIPSIFRSAISVKAAQGTMVSIDSDLFWRNIIARQRQKFRLMDGLINQNGRIIGNILAQQYGLSSEGLDFTGTPRIAAFFATKKHPSYEHFMPSKDQRLGVIYRLPRGARYFLTMNSKFNFDELERRLGWIGGFYKRQPVWFQMYFKLSELDSTNPRENPEGYFNLFGGSANVVLNTRPIILPYEDFEQQLVKIFGGIDRIQDTRVIRQNGGLIRPPIVYQGQIPRNGKIEIDEYGDFLVSPAVCVVEKLIGVYDLLAYKEVEAFFFEHSDHEIKDYAPSFLWPSEDVDTMFRVTSLFAHMNSLDYLSDFNTDVDNQELGLIDRGYYNE